MRGQLVDGRRVSPPSGLARRGKFVAGHFRPWTGTERVEDAYGGTQLLACLDTLSRSSQVRAISELRAGGLENVRRLLMQGQRRLDLLEFLHIIEFLNGDAPAGLFTLGATSLTVPAGGRSPEGNEKQKERPGEHEGEGEHDAEGENAEDGDGAEGAAADLAAFDGQGR